MNAENMPDDRKQELYRESDELLERYIALFQLLQERARRYGLNSLLILHSYDPLVDSSGYASSLVGDEYAVCEAARRALRLMHEDN